MTRGRSRGRTALGTLAAGIIALAVVLGGATAPASADSPVDFGATDIVDTAGVLGADTTSVQDAIDSLQADTGQGLLVAFVPTFENPADREQWAQRTAEINQLGESNVLLAVAVDDRLYQLWFSDGSELQADSEQIAEDYILPSLSQDDWAGAAIGAADGIRAASSGELDGGAGSGDGSSSTGGGGNGGTVLLWFFLIAGAVALLIVVISLIRRRRRAALARASAEKDRAALEQQAGSLLVQLDDALKTSEQEVGFASAEFGDEAVKPFTDALAAANTSAREAFAIKQKLDDAFPESPEERASMTAEITRLATEAIAGLDARSDEFDALRALDDNAVSVLKTVTTDAETLGARLTETDERIADLGARFEGETMSTLSGNAVQARRLLDFAAETARTAAAALAAPAPAAGARPSVAIPVRAAQQSIGQAAQLLDAVDTVSATLTEATAAVASEIADVEADLAEARHAVAANPSLAGPISGGEQAVAAARQQTGTRTDPVATVRRLQEAEAVLDAALAPAREEQVQRERAMALLSRTQVGAQSQIAAAADFISTRRGAVGSDARQRLSEAQRLLDASGALAAADPVQALTHAQRSQAMAASAIQLAQSDVDGYNDQGPWSGGGGGGRSGGGGDAMTGAIIGGILGGLLSGGGGSSGGLFGGGGGGGGGGWSGGGGGGFGGGFGGGGSGGRF
ncbi:MAG: TPM domain-containing protein [Leifsonia sp.]